MDYLGMLKGEQMIEISEGFDYIRATQDFVGLRLFPMFRTDNMKLAVASLVEGGDVPVMALVHALDTEARIGDRPDYKEINYELLLVKEKLNQGEALRKKIKDLGMSREEAEIVRAIYNDAANLISRVLTRFEAMADEALCTGKLAIRENNVTYDIDYALPANHRLTVSAWASADHDIIADLVAIKKNAKNKIVRAYTSDKIMGYIVNNAKLNSIAGTQGAYVTADWARNYINNILGIDFVVVDGTYKLSAQDDTEYNFFNEDVITFATTAGTLGNTFVTSTPEEDYGFAQRTNGFVAVSQDVTFDPAGVWTKASAVAFPAFRDVKQIYICTVA